MKPRSRRAPLFLGLVVVVILVVLDQWSKAGVFAMLEPPPLDLSLDVHGHRRLLLAGEWLSFMTSCNPGAAFGQFGDFPHALVGGRILAVGLLLWLLVFRSDPRHRAIFVAMLLVLAGAIGNLIDNLWTGCIEIDHPYLGVRDFIDVWFLPLGWDYHFPSFNVADSCISVGAVLWVISGFFHHRDEDAEGEEGAAASS